MRSDDLLPITLAAAVPLWIERLKERSFEDVLARTQECAQMIAEHGDDILYPSKRKGETAAAFNALAEAIAIGAFMPGGIKIFGMHFDATHPDEEEAP